MKNLLVLTAVVVCFNSCSKDSPSIPDPNSAPKISALPNTFLQKVVIENFTMTSCGQCPKYHLMLDSLINYNPGRVYGLTIHVNDVMQDTNLLTVNGGNYYDSIFNPTAIYPSGMVNRRVTSLNDLMPDNWPSTVYSNLGNSTPCGIAIEAENIVGGNLFLKVHLGFLSTLPGQYNLHAFLVQDQVYSNDSIYDQMNDYSYEGATPDSNLSLYPQNDTIHLYRHKYVLKKIIADNGPEGDPIPVGSAVGGNQYIANYTVDLSGINVDNCYILVYIDKYATTSTGHRIANAQVARIGTTQDWN